MNARIAFSALSGPRGRRRLLIFTYHRVLEQPDELLPGEPSEQQFDVHARLIAESLNVLPLGRAVQQLHEGTLPRGAACITFDDGYKNNYEVAVPILERYGLAATFFIAAGALETGSMFNDRVIEAVRAAPDRLDLRDLNLGCWDCSSATSRCDTIRRLLDQIKYRPLHEREQLTRAIHTRLSPRNPLDLMMEPAMLRDLFNRGFEIGGHTMNHPILANLPYDVARSEIADGRDWLAGIIGEQPTTFAYPNGRRGVDFLPEHTRLVEELGFTCAVTTHWAVATVDEDPFELPRLTPWEFDRLGWSTRIAKNYVRSWLPGPQ